VVSPARPVRGDAQVSSYLYSIARRVAANARRTAQRNDRRHQALRYNVTASPPDPEEVVAERQAEFAFGRAIAGLPPKLREVYLLSTVDGLTAQQIGLALGLSANTVSSRIRLTRARLQAELRDQLPAANREHAAEPVAEARSRVWAMLVPLLPRESAAIEAGRATPMLALAGAIGLVAVLVITVLGRPAPAPAVPAGVPATRRADVTAAIAAPPASEPAPQPAPQPPAASQLAAPPRDGDDTLAHEARMLAVAQRRLRDGDPDAALAQLRLHAMRFAAGALADERDALIAAALCQRGEHAAGRAAAAELAARAPGSTALSTARVACESAVRAANESR
jgi:RNA polymerase sigma factor (sigma-70 family)